MPKNHIETRFLSVDKKTKLIELINLKPLN